MLFIAGQSAVGCVFYDTFAVECPVLIMAFRSLDAGPGFSLSVVTTTRLKKKTLYVKSSCQPVNQQDKQSS